MKKKEKNLKKVAEGFFIWAKQRKRGKQGKTIGLGIKIQKKSCGSFGKSGTNGEETGSGQRALG